jgi:hypothetical protein
MAVLRKWLESEGCDEGWEQWVDVFEYRRDKEME